MENNPFVSVIIPAHNDQNRLKLCLEAINLQSYPSKNYEIIVIDNNSTENIEKIAKDSSDKIKILKESKPYSYAARNKGIANAKGEIIAFTDSDCIPGREWIEKGVLTMIENSADLVGGKIEFYFSNKQTLSEVYDSLFFLNSENAVKKGLCQTANLFVRKKIFLKLGYFPEVVSGGDSQWTKNATDQGYRLTYSSKAIVKHPARKFSALLIKSLRVAQGEIPYLLNQNKNFLEIFLILTRKSLPRRITTIKKIIDHTNSESFKQRFIQLWLLTFVFGFILFWWRLLLLFRNLKKILLK